MLQAVLAALARLALLLAVCGCEVDEIDFTGKTCPCGGEYVCDRSTNRCTRRALDAGRDARAMDAGRDAGSGTDGGSDAGPPPVDAGPMLDPYPAAVLADGPVAYWRLDEPAGSATARDASGNEHDGTYLGGITLGATGIDGGGAAAFDGTSGRVVFGDVLDFADNVPFTLEVWLDPETLDNTYRRIIDKNGYPSGRQGYTTFLRGAAMLDGGLRSTLALERWRDDVKETADAYEGVDPDAFNHVVLTYDGASCRVYLNGAQIAEADAPTPLLDTSLPLVLGSNSDQDAAFYSGVMDEVAIYDRALSVDEIAEHYAIGTSGS